MENKELIDLLKSNLTVEIDVKIWSNIHEVKTVVKFGNEVISETTKKCSIGIEPNYS